MKQYIDKSVLVAEIQRRIKECDKLAGAAADNNLSNTLQANELLIRQYTSLLNFLDTLEVKEVEDKCKDCTNDKGCINCDDGNMHEVKKKKPEGALKELLDNIDPTEYENTRKEMLKEAACEDLEKAVQAYSNLYNDECFDAIGSECPYIKNAFKAGANWRMENLLKPADGDDLPEIDREVIVLYQRYPLENNEYAVGFGHRPREYWDGKNIDTGEVTRYYPEKYDKGRWNSPNIKWWLDLDLPKKEL